MGQEEPGGAGRYQGGAGKSQEGPGRAWRVRRGQEEPGGARNGRGGASLPGAQAASGCELWIKGGVATLLMGFQ